MEALAGVGASEVTRVVTAVPESNVEQTMPVQSRSHTVPPPRSSERVARSRGSIRRPALWLGSILMACSLVGLILLGSFQPGGDDPSEGEPDSSNSRAILPASSSSSSSVPPQVAPSPTPTPIPSPSPSPAPTATPDVEPPAATPVAPSPSGEPDHAAPQPSDITTHLLEREKVIRSEFSERVQDIESQYSPGF